MRTPGLTALLGAVCAAALAFLFSCASGPVVIPSNLSAAEIFQRAQDASDRGDYKLAMRYYSTVQSSHPDDINHITWASYEIAYLYHKMGNDRMALKLFNDLLDKYATEGNTLPPAPQILAAKLKARLEETLKKQQPKQPAQTSQASPSDQINQTNQTNQTTQ